MGASLEWQYATTLDYKVVYEDEFNNLFMVAFENARDSRPKNEHEFSLFIGAVFQVLINRKELENEEK